jgi:hypothetical protein
MVTMGKLPQTPRARAVIEHAVEEARNLGCAFVGPEHLLLGLLREPEGWAARVLADLGFTLDDIREEVLNRLRRQGPGAREGEAPAEPRTGLTGGPVCPESLTPGSAGASPSRARSSRHEGDTVGGGYERFSDQARKVMQLANQEAQRLNHEYIGTEHILLGLLKEGSGVAAGVLELLQRLAGGDPVVAYQRSAFALLQSLRRSAPERLALVAAASADLKAGGLGEAERAPLEELLARAKRLLADQSDAWPRVEAMVEAFVDPVRTPDG